MPSSRELIMLLVAVVATVSGVRVEPPPASLRSAQVVPRAVQNKIALVLQLKRLKEESPTQFSEVIGLVPQNNALSTIMSTSDFNSILGDAKRHFNLRCYTDEQCLDGVTKAVQAVLDRRVDREAAGNPAAKER